MTPRRLPIRLACPKGERWSDMAPEDGGRRCLRCDRHLIDLSELTAAQAGELEALARAGGARRICAKVSLDADGAPIHATRAVRRLVQAAAGVVISVSLAACDATGGAEQARTPEPSVEMQPVPPVAEELTERAPAADEPPTARAAEPESNGTTAADTDTAAATRETPEPATADTSMRERPRPAKRRAPRDEEIVGLVYDEL